MISAGQNYPPQVPSYGQQGYGQSGYGQQGYGPYSQCSQAPSFQPVTLPNQSVAPTGGPNMNINWTPEGEQGQKFMQGYMWGQFGLQAGGMLNGMVNMIANYSLASQAMTEQRKIATKYYNVQDNIANYQMQVSLAQLDVQQKGTEAMRDMHTEQCRHEERMAKLAGNTEARIEKEKQKGMTERAKIFAVTDAFSRRGWDMGSPAFAA